MQSKQLRTAQIVGIIFRSSLVVSGVLQLATWGTSSFAAGVSVIQDAAVADSKTQTGSYFFSPTTKADVILQAKQETMVQSRGRSPAVLGPAKTVVDSNFSQSANRGQVSARGSLSVADPKIRQQIVNALSQGRNMRDVWKNLYDQHGTQALRTLLAIAHNEREQDQLRWVSIFGIVRMTGKAGLSVVHKFAKHPNWMLRNAALKSIAAVDAIEYRSVLENALDDKALVVRTAAVDAIEHLKLKSSAPKLVDALFDKQNFRHDKPLWIHRHILSALKSMDYKEATPRLVDLLERKKDESLRTEVVAALEHLTGKSFRDKPLNEQVFLWRRNTVNEINL